MAAHSEDPDFLATLAQEAKKHLAGVNGLSRKVAEELIDAYPTATSTGDKSRYDVAAERVLRRLTAEEVERDIAVRIGLKKAKRALVKAQSDLERS